MEKSRIRPHCLVTELSQLLNLGNYSAKKVKRSKKRLDRVFLEKAKMHLCPSVLSILS